jgi:hypothetical protein
MRLQLRRIVRTLQSEQYAFFDLDHLDQEGLPRSLGKADLHFTDQAAYGTVLLWRAHFAHLPDEELRSFVQALMDELGTPMGVPSEFLIECVLADEQDYRVYSNMLEAVSASGDAVGQSS